MIGFILCSVLLATLVQKQSELLQLLATPVALYISLTVMAISLLAGYLKKFSPLFGTMALRQFPVGLYAYWAPQFDACAHVLFFPIYYAMLASIVTLTLINRSEDFDQEFIRHLRYLEKNNRFSIS